MLPGSAWRCSGTVELRTHPELLGHQVVVPSRRPPRSTTFRLASGDGQLNRRRQFNRSRTSCGDSSLSSSHQHSSMTSILPCTSRCPSTYAVRRLCYSARRPQPSLSRPLARLACAPTSPRPTAHSPRSRTSLRTASLRPPRLPDPAHVRLRPCTHALAVGRDPHAQPAASIACEPISSRPRADAALPTLTTPRVSRAPYSRCAALQQSSTRSGDLQPSAVATPPLPCAYPFFAYPPRVDSHRLLP